MSRGLRELAVLQFPFLVVVGVQNESFTFTSNPLFASKTEFPMRLKPTKCGPIRKNWEILNNIPRRSYHFFIHDQLKIPHHHFGCIFLWMGEKNPGKCDTPVLHSLAIHHKWSASLNKAQAGTRYLLLRKPKVDACQGFVQLPGFADKERPLWGKPLLCPWHVLPAAPQKQGTWEGKKSVDPVAPQLFVCTTGLGGRLWRVHTGLCFYI